MTLFQDDFDIADLEELYGSVEWRRPYELSKKPCLKQSLTPSLSVQGSLGDCWLILAFSCLSDENIWKRVFSKQDVLHGSSYSGKLTVIFWVNGEDVEVTIDDRLPLVKTAQSLQAVGVSCICLDEFWAPLLEKAFAKLYGSYSKLISGQVSTGFLLLSGGYIWKENIKLNTKLENLYNKLKKAIEYNCYIFFSTDNEKIWKKFSSNRNEKEFCNNVPQLHCYKIYGLSELNVFVSSTWDDSIATFSLRDLVDAPTLVTICSVNFEWLTGNKNQKHFTRYLSGSWEANKTSGGNKKMSTFNKNPKFNATIKHGMSGLVYIDLFQNHTDVAAKPKQAINIHAKVVTSDNLTWHSCSVGYDYSKHTSLIVPLGNTDDDVKLSIIPSTFDANINSTFLVRVCMFADFTIRQEMNTNNNFNEEMSTGIFDS